MQLYAKTDESDVGRVNVGRPVTFKVDAFPKETFTGVVREIRMNATTVQNVVTYDAIIDFANPQLKLFPGMTAYVTIPVASVEDVVKVPNSALRYRPPLPPEEIRALYVKYPGAGTGPAGGASVGRGVRLARRPRPGRGRQRPTMASSGSDAETTRSNRCRSRWGLPITPAR